MNYNGLAIAALTFATSASAQWVALEAPGPVVNLNPNELCRLSNATQMEYRRNLIRCWTDLNDGWVSLAAPISTANSATWRKENIQGLGVKWDGETHTCRVGGGVFDVDGIRALRFHFELPAAAETDCLDRRWIEAQLNERLEDRVRFRF